MPPGIGYGMRGGPAGAPSDPTGSPQPGVFPQQSLTGMPDEEALAEIVAMLRGGQVGAERFIELLALLTGSMMGSQQPMQQSMQGQMDPSSIASLLGG